MPYIHVQTNTAIAPEQRQAMTKEFGEAITIVGKSESWLMLRFEDGCAMAFRGRDDCSMAFVSVSLYGGGRNLDTFTGKVCQILHRELGIDPDQIYVRYLCTDDWGWNGGNF